MELKIKKIVAYRRLSQPKKGKSKEETVESAYGIEAQDNAVERLRHDHSATVVATYTEIETGTNKKTRPELQKAIAHARLIKATLVIAKLDRLARNTHFITGLQEAEVDFVSCDNPHANRMTIQLMAVMAEDEARRISQRTRESLAVAKEKGVLLGSARPGHWRGREHLRGYKAANKESIKARRQKTENAYGFLIDPIREMRKEKSLEQVAQWLNEQGHCTQRGTPFIASTVMRIINFFHRQKKREKAA